jgi:hypoxanthine-DNA glycosylase
MKTGLPTQARKTGLPPIVDESTAIVILGTLPSDQSIAANEYYANPGNDFWRLMESALGQPLHGLPYEAKLEILRNFRIGLWDAFHSCNRPGSMDSAIRAAELNDFRSLKRMAPKIRLVCCNGTEAAKAIPALAKLNYQTVLLPSSSGANRRHQQERLRRWVEAIVHRDGIEC